MSASATMSNAVPVPMALFQATSTSSEATISLGRSTSSSNDSCGRSVTIVPNVVHRQKKCRVVQRSTVDVAALIYMLKSESISTMGLRLSGNKVELNSLIHALIVDTNHLLSAASVHGGLIVSSVLTLLSNDLRGKILLEAILTDETAVWHLATQTVGLQNIYDLADKEWKLGLHQALIPRLSELSSHPQGNYMVSHMLRAYPIHQDAELMRAATAMFSDGNELVNMCQGKSAVFVAVAWASVASPSTALTTVLTLLDHPKAPFVFYRLAMSGVAYKIVSSLLIRLANTQHEHLIVTIVTQHIRGARYVGKIRSELRTQVGISV
jgi:hypothetical protein